MATLFWDLPVTVWFSQTNFCNITLGNYFYKLKIYLKSGSWGEIFVTNILEILVDTNKSLCTPVVPCTFIKVFI